MEDSYHLERMSTMAHDGTRRDDAVRAPDVIAIGAATQSARLAFAGLLAGFVHVLSGPDHLAAIAPYAVDGKTSRVADRRSMGTRAHCRRPRRRSPGALLRDALPRRGRLRVGRAAVGLVLIGIGIWGIRAALGSRKPAATRSRTHIHGHAAFAVGTLQGSPAALMCSA